MCVATVTGAMNASSPAGCPAQSQQDAGRRAAVSHGFAPLPATPRARRCRQATPPSVVSSRRPPDKQPHIRGKQRQAGIQAGIAQLGRARLARRVRLAQSVHRVSTSSPGQHGLPQPWHVRASPRWPLKPSSMPAGWQPSCPRCGPPAGRPPAESRMRPRIPPCSPSVTSGPQRKAFPCGPSAHRALSEGTAPVAHISWRDRRATAVARRRCRELLLLPVDSHLHFIPIQTDVGPAGSNQRAPAGITRRSMPVALS